MVGGSTDGIEILVGHHVAHEVLELIRNSAEYLVSATAYLESWLHLKQEILAAHERGVKI